MHRVAARLYLEARGEDNMLMRSVHPVPAAPFLVLPSAIWSAVCASRSVCPFTYSRHSTIHASMVLRISSRRREQTRRLRWPMLCFSIYIRVLVATSQSVHWHAPLFVVHEAPEHRHRSDTGGDKYGCLRVRECRSSLTGKILFSTVSLPVLIRDAVC